MQHAQNGGRADPKSEQKRNADEQFDYAHRVAEKYSVRQNQTREDRAIEADRRIRDVVLQIILKTAVGKARAHHFIFSEQQEERRRGDAHTGNGTGQS